MGRLCTRRRRAVGGAGGRAHVRACGGRAAGWAGLDKDLAALEDDTRALLEEIQQVPATPPPEADGGAIPVELGDEGRGLASSRPWRRVTARGGSVEVKPEEMLSSR